MHRVILTLPAAHLIGTEGAYPRAVGTLRPVLVTSAVGTPRCVVTLTGATMLPSRSDAGVRSSAPHTGIDVALLAEGTS